MQVLVSALKAAHRAYFRFVLPITTPGIEHEQEVRQRGGWNTMTSIF